MALLLLLAALALACVWIASPFMGFVVSYAVWIVLSLPISDATGFSYGVLAWVPGVTLLVTIFIYGLTHDEDGNRRPSSTLPSNETAAERRWRLAQRRRDVDGLRASIAQIQARLND